MVTTEKQIENKKEYELTVAEQFLLCVCVIINDLQAALIVKEEKTVIEVKRNTENVWVTYSRLGIYSARSDRFVNFFLAWPLHSFKGKCIYRHTVMQ